MRTLPLLLALLLLAGCESDEEKLVRLRQEEAVAEQAVEAAEARLEFVRDSLARNPNGEYSARVELREQEQQRVSEAEASLEIIQRDIRQLLQ